MPEDRKISDHLANERTFLAWIRTRVGLMGSSGYCLVADVLESV